VIRTSKVTRAAKSQMGVVNMTLHEGSSWGRQHGMPQGFSSKSSPKRLWSQGRGPPAQQGEACFDRPEPSRCRFVGAGALNPATSRPWHRRGARGA